MIHKQSNRILINTCLIILLAVISVVPAFIGHFYSLSFDGGFHLERFENVYLSLKHGSIPNIFNYQYVTPSSYPGVAINAMYPWIMGLLFIIPRLFVQNPMIALMIGFLLLNAITMINIGLLLRYFTSNNFYLWMGIIIYEFNNFHLIDLYSRTSMGESFGYAWFPLVLLGVLKINNFEKNGKWILAIGMGMIANSHVLSLLLAILFVAGFEIVKCFQKKISLKIFYELLLASLASIFIGLYSLTNVVMVYAHNNIMSPGNWFYAIDPEGFFSLTIQNNMGEKPYWSYGLPLLVVQIVLTIIAFSTDNKSNWKKWLLSGNIVFLTLFSWWPWFWIKNTFITIIQFTARVELIVILLLAIAITLYFDQRKAKISRSILISFFVIIFSLFGAYQAHENSKSIHDSLNSENYYQIISTKNITTDYLPIGSVELLENKSANSFYDIISDKRSINGITYKVDVKRDGTIKLPTVMYSGFKYKVRVNGFLKTSKAKNIVELPLTRGEYSIDVQSVDAKNNIMLLISCFSFVCIILFIFINLKRA